MLFKCVLAFAIVLSAGFPPEEVLICNSNTFYAYHTTMYRRFARCTHEIIKITLQQAKKEGRTLCGNGYKGVGMSSLVAPAAVQAVTSHYWESLLGNYQERNQVL